mmetsp:Transcript_24205/g.43304  ORF Transcript_24205/g.43304 Transcript_24205/m.43304 type:complete len:526 (-) Transcript_24205:15-1592(-)
MSDVYIKEPATKGKVVLTTTHGDLEIELWATETPKACRNFCQLCLEGYYNGTSFHRVIKEFLIQGGDGTGTGDGCESIYGAPYIDEIHTRLKFRYRGMLGVASAGKNTKTNGSQFFIVLNRTPSLDGKHTIFGKVVGQTIYNLVRISEVEVDKHDSPVDPPRIIRADLVYDPFGDLEPRYKPVAIPKSLTEKPHRRAPVHKKNVLSFTADEDADSDEDGEKASSSNTKGKSAHELLNDPKLSKAAAYSEEAAKKRETKDAAQKRRSEAAPAEASETKRFAARPAAARGKPSKKDSDAEEEADFDADSDASEDGPKGQREVTREEEILKLKRDIAGLHSGREPVVEKKGPGGILEAMRKGYSARGEKEKPRGKDARRAEAEEIVHRMKMFQDRLRDQNDSDEEPAEEPKKKEPEVSKKKKGDAETIAFMWEEGDEETDKDWLTGGGLKFQTSADKAFKVGSQKASKTLEIFDPLAARGNAEVLEDARKKRAAQLVPSLRRVQPAKDWSGRDAMEVVEPRRFTKTGL